MRTFLVMMALVGCGDDNQTVDAAVKDAEIDAAPVTLDCPAYCAEIQANCTGANAQYPDVAHCTATCASFTVGTSKVTDTAGNSLGCRIYHGGDPSKTTAATHCVHAGPGGDLITAATPAFCSGGDVCASFCALEIKACGSLDAPLPGNPTDGNNNPLFQYLNMANCMAVCATFDKTHPYSTAATGNSLACRLYHATNAAIDVTPNGATHCSHTAAVPTGPCAGAATP
jgi:hypothetical protein